MTKNKAKFFQRLKSVDKLVEFFDKHDMGKYWDRLPKAEFDVSIKTRKHLVAIDEKIIPRINQIAKRRESYLRNSSIRGCARKLQLRSGHNQPVKPCRSKARARSRCITKNREATHSDFRFSVPQFLVCATVTANPHFSPRGEIEGCKPPDNISLDDLAPPASFLPQQNRQWDADCRDSALYEPTTCFAGVAILSLPIRQITSRQARLSRRPQFVGAASTPVGIA